SSSSSSSKRLIEERAIRLDDDDEDDDEHEAAAEFADPLPGGFLEAIRPTCVPVFTSPGGRPAEPTTQCPL
ncbi:MAG TPA: hypothetical protein VNE39_13980, partial [Planctomycetota bacterium]|nr:hypothetical protein [Planctomycetota bacterium]